MLYLALLASPNKSACTVILDIHPFFTTLIILSGWFGKNAMATFVSGWVGGNATAEAWLAYSIP